MVRQSWWIAGAAIVAATGCAHSEGDWQAQLHTISDLRAKLDGDQAQLKKVSAELDESTAKLDQLNQQLKTAGLDAANLSANLETQARATEEYRRRAEQRAELKRRFEALRAALAPLSKQGLAVTVRNNRVVIQVEADALFDAGREALKRDGRGVLLKIAEVIRGDQGLAARTYQVAGHADGALPSGRSKDDVGLSVLRARAALALLVQPVDKGGGGLNASRWSAAGYGSADPLKASGAPGSNQANARLEIILQPAVEEVLDLRALGP
jgi:chemotaxis protein MotB